MSVVVRRWQPAQIGVAGPTARDMARSFSAVRSDPLSFLVATQQRYGDLVGFPVPGPAVLLVSDPADVRRVLQHGARRWVKRTVQYSSLARLTGPGLLASSDSTWFPHRRAAAPAFHHERSIVPLPAWAPRPTSLRLRAARRELDRLCDELVARRRAARGDTHGADLLGLLIDAGDEIHDELITMIVAGHETVAAALSWTLMLLAQHQQAQGRVREELGQLPDGVPLLRAAQSAPWLHAVLCESLRLYPPAWVVSRRATSADALGDVEVPAGTTAIISPWVVHRRAASWPEPTWRPPAPWALLAAHPSQGMPLRLSPVHDQLTHDGAAA